MKEKLMKFGRRAIKSSMAPVRNLINDLKAAPAHSAAGRVVIVYYHRIVADIRAAEQEAIFGLLNSTASFRRQLEILREQYEILPLSEALGVLRGERQTARPAAVITFDDGYRDNYEQAFPVLRAMNLPATIFVSSGFVGTKQPLHHDRIHWLMTRARQQRYDLREALQSTGLRALRIDELARTRETGRLVSQFVHLPYLVRERLIEKLEAALSADYPPGYELLTWEMIAEMQQAGLGFGGHTDRHPILTLEDSDTIEREIRRNKKMLEERLNEPVRHFAYPNGSYNAAIKRLVVRMGFETAVTTERRVALAGDDLHALARIGMCEETTRGILGNYSEAVARMRLLLN